MFVEGTFVFQFVFGFILSTIFTFLQNYIKSFHYLLRMCFKLHIFVGFLAYTSLEGSKRCEAPSTGTCQHSPSVRSILTSPSNVCDFV